MKPSAAKPSSVESLLIDRIRQGDAEAWNDLIGQYEGRLLAYVEARTHNRATAEDLVQETFIGFLTSLPNFDRRRPLESYLFSIAAHKLTDHLRREGRRPTLPLIGSRSETSDWEPAGSARAGSSIARSKERKDLEETALADALARQIEQFRNRGQWQRLQCVELLFVRGWTNQQTAARLGMTEQAVANCKFEFIARLRAAIQSQGLPEDVFPELYR